MEGILALMIPVLAMATGFVAMVRMPREALAAKRYRRMGYVMPEPSADQAALVAEVALLREELAQVRERLDFTERLLMDPAPAQRLGAAAVHPLGASPVANSAGPAPLGTPVR